MTNGTISNVAFAGVFVAIGLVVFGVVSNKTGILLGGGLLAVGFFTRPPDTSTQTA